MIERTEAPSAPAAPARTWDVAIVGAGYVGVPLARTFALAGRSVLLVDVLQDVVDALNRGESRGDVRAEAFGPLVAAGRISASTDYDSLRDADAIVIALPTPLSKQRSPTPILLQATREIAKRLRRVGVVLESTTYPGTTRDGCCRCSSGSGPRGRRLQPRVLAGARRPRLVVGRARGAEGGRRRHRGMHDAGRGALPRGDQPGATVSSPEAAELTKLLENIFR